ncbi:MAG: hypothetical protein ACR2HX_22320 [Pyrinomonadaceae bacterium]
MKKNSTTEQERCEQQADAVAMFLTLGDCDNASTPDFVTDAVIDAIDEAGDLLGLPTPTYGDEESQTERRKLLIKLFSQTKMLRLRDDQIRVARALHELYHNPQTPTQLHEALGEFVCAAMNDTEHVVQYRQPFLLDLIKAVDDPMSRRIAEREERERREAN